MSKRSLIREGEETRGLLLVTYFARDLGEADRILNLLYAAYNAAGTRQDRDSSCSYLSRPVALGNGKERQNAACEPTGHTTVLGRHEPSIVR